MCSISTPWGPASPTSSAMAPGPLPPAEPLLGELGCLRTLGVLAMRSSYEHICLSYFSCAFNLPPLFLPTCLSTSLPLGTPIQQSFNPCGLPTLWSFHHPFNFLAQVLLNVLSLPVCICWQTGQLFSEPVSHSKLSNENSCQYMLLTLVSNFS